MSALQAIVIAILQGATELFPVSSLGHAVVLPALLHWPIDQRSPEFLPFLVMLHLGTATALLLFFWRDWWSLATGVLGLASPHQTGESRRVFALIVIATIPAVIIGFLLEKFFRNLFGTPVVAAVFLIVNAVLLLGGEKLRGRGHRPLSESDHDGCADDRLLAVHRVDPGHFALRRHDRRRPAARYRPRGFGAFLVPDRDTDHPRGNGAGGPEAAARERPARNVQCGGARRGAGRRHRLCQHLVPDALLPSARCLGAQSVRVLLPGRRRRQSAVAACGDERWHPPPSRTGRGRFVAYTYTPFMPPAG